MIPEGAAWPPEGWEVVESETKGRAMTERDELIQIIWDGAVADRVKDGKDLSTVPVIHPKVEAMADEILDAGFLKPRTITTREELDALPVEAVIRDSDTCVLEHWGEPDAWMAVAVSEPIPSDQIALPAIVLYEPDASE